MSYIVLDSLQQQRQSLLSEQFALDVLLGFSGPAKFLPSKYFYDSNGSRLFEAITDLEQYYPTRCEFEILQKCGTQLAQYVQDEPFEIVELGAGDGRKTKVLLSRLLEGGQQFTYSPVDISESAVADLVASLQRSHEGLQTRGIVGEYFDSIRYLESNSKQRKLVLFLGSNIGNFDAAGARRFLATIWRGLNPGDLLLVGFDLKKDIAVMHAAYNDSEGVTARFNLNVLQRINNELGGHFKLDNFVHHGLYNPVRGAMESYLVSTRDQQVDIDSLHKTFHFEAYEAIHLEYSYKYLLADIDAMARETGFDKLQHWTDSRGYFADSLWQVRKRS